MLSEGVHRNLSSLEARVSQVPARVTGIPGVRIMRLISMIYGTGADVVPLSTQVIPADASKAAIERVHGHLAALECRMTREPIRFTGIQGVRIMRLISLLSGTRMTLTQRGAQLALPEPYAHHEIVVRAPEIHAARWRRWIVAALLIGCCTGGGATFVIQRAGLGKSAVLMAGAILPVAGPVLPPRVISPAPSVTPWSPSMPHPVAVSLQATPRGPYRPYRTAGHATRLAGRAIEPLIHRITPATSRPVQTAGSWYASVGEEGGGNTALSVSTVRSASQSDWYGHLVQRRVSDIAGQFVR
jgi:hypothetical protein